MTQIAIAKSLQSCPTLCNPIDGSPPGSRFSRQEHWSGLPFPSPLHESEKWKWSRSVVSDSQGPHGLQPTRLLHPWDFPGKSTGVGCHCLLRKWPVLHSISCWLATIDLYCTYRKKWHTFISQFLSFFFFPPQWEKYMILQKPKLK